MAKHTLTDEQMKKFYKAIDGQNEILLRGGTFTTAELSGLVKQVNGFQKGPPNITDDPLVNYAVDCVVEYEAGEEEDEYDASLYADEVEVWRQAGSFDAATLAD